ncbi:MAG: hypothetical protein ABUU24_07400, partial [Variovorax sp.]
MDNSNGITYADLICDFERTAKDMAVPQKRNWLSALSQYQKHFGLNNGSPIEPTLGSNFEHDLNAFLSARYARTPGTADNLKSWLRGWNRLAVVLRSFRFKSLHEAASHWFDRLKTENPKLTLNGFGRQHGFSVTETRWFFRQCVVFGASSLASVQRLEEALNAPRGSLTAFTRHIYAPTNRELSEFSKRQFALGKKPIRLKGDQVGLDGLIQEWRELFDFKTDAVVMGTIKRNVAWRLRPIAEAAIKPKFVLENTTTADGKRYSATADFQFGLVCLFFGALAQIEKKGHPGEKKYNPANFSLAWMADYAVMKECVDHLVVRYEGVYTNTIERLLIASQVFLHPEFGWVRQNEGFKQKLITPISGGKHWSQWCDQQLELLNRYFKQLNDGKKFTQTRNPF